MGHDERDTPTPSGKPTPADTPEEHQRRLNALRALAQEQTPDATTNADASSGVSAGAMQGALARPRRSRVVWQWGALAIVALVAVVAAFTLPNVLHRTTAPQARALAITPYADNLACPLDVAWSPNGRLLAVLGFYLTCPNTTSDHMSPGQVNIYDAATGKLVQRFQPDALILHGHGVTLSTQTQLAPNGGGFTPFIGYTAMVWSPDGKRLALPFVALQAPYTIPTTDIGAQSASAAQMTLVGVLLTDVAGKQARVLTAPYRLPAVGAGAYAPYRTSVEWDLTAGAPSAPSLTLPAALGYQWGGQGALQPLTSLTTTGAPRRPALAPIGNPIGGKSFTIWQPGIADQAFLPTPPSTTPSATPQPSTPQEAVGVYFWATRFPVWSPDGRYLIAPANYGGRLVGGAPPTPATLTQAEQTQTAVVPTRDAALQSLIQPDAYAPVAWSPDGRLMASVAYVIGGSAGISTEKVNLTDCATGRLIKTFTLTVKAQFTPAVGADGLGPASDYGVFLRWSADGSQLAFMDANLGGVITIWGAGALPRV